MKKLLCAVAIAAVASAGAARASVEIFAGYDGGADNSFFQIQTDADLTNVQFTASGGVPGPGTWNVADGTFTTGTNTAYFPDFGGAFTFDYDDFYTGTESFGFSATYKGHTVTAAFSPDSNDSGGFNGFLGNDSNGNEWDADQFGHVATAGGVPEPATWALMLGGFGLAGATLRRRRAAVA